MPEIVINIFAAIGALVVAAGVVIGLILLVVSQMKEMP